MANTSSPRILAQTILDYLWDDKNTAMADEILRQGREMLLAGGGQLGSVVTAAENGKSMTRRVDMTAEDALGAARTAKKWYEAGVREIPTRTVGTFA